MIINQKPRRIKITGMSPKDACFGDKEKYIGRTGMFIPDINQHNPGYFAGYIEYDLEWLEGEYLCEYFYAIRYRRI